MWGIYCASVTTHTYEPHIGAHYTEICRGHEPAELQTARRRESRARPCVAMFRANAFPLAFVVILGLGSVEAMQSPRGRRSTSIVDLPPQNSLPDDGTIRSEETARTSDEEMARVAVKGSTKEQVLATDGKSHWASSGSIACNVRAARIRA